MSAGTVWVVNTRGIFAVEVMGVYSTEARARIRAQELDFKSDHYHSWEIVEVRVDVDHELEEINLHLGFNRARGHRRVPIVTVRIGDDS